jgi:hypothetical protein
MELGKLLCCLKRHKWKQVRIAIPPTDEDYIGISESGTPTFKVRFRNSVICERCNREM